MWPWGGGAPEVDIGDNVQNSLMLDSTVPQYLLRTLVTGAPSLRDTSDYKKTFSIQVKRGKLGAIQMLISNMINSLNAYWCFYFDASDHLCYYSTDSTTVATKVSSAQFRDTAKYYDITISIDGTLATAEDRVQIEVDGVRITSWGTNTQPVQNNVWHSCFICHPFAAVVMYFIVGFRADSLWQLDGYVGRLLIVDGQQLNSSNFNRTSVDTGAWVNKTYTGTYGVNGGKYEWLNGASLGTDTSGNGNNWTLNGGIVAANQTTDTPTNNYCVLNPLWGGSGTLSYGNLKFTGPTGWASKASSIKIPSTGKWTAFAKILAQPFGYGDGSAYAAFGVTTAPTNSAQSYISTTSLHVSDSGYTHNFSATGVGLGVGFDINDVITLNLDRDANTYEIRKNDVAVASGTIGASAGTDLYYVQISYSTAYGQMQLNFGQTTLPYALATGYKTLCTANLPQPSIIKPAKYFKAKTRTGTGAAANITGIEFQPDMVWSKSRSAATSHMLANSVVGSTKYLSSDSTAAEVTDAQSVTAFNADGFSVGTAAILNTNTATYIDWMWDKGVIPGLDIVSYVGTGSAQNIAHNLGVAPSFVIIKALNSAQFWRTWNKNLSAGQYIYLNSSATPGTDAGWITPSSTVLALAGSNSIEFNAAPYNYLAIVFAEVEGFSKVLRYSGNNSADGTFVYLGFRPAWVMIRRIDSVGDWTIFDTARSLSNPVNLELYAELSNAETSSALLDATSTGFKLRSASAQTNGLGTYDCIAFAEMPIKYSNAR